MPTYVYKCPVHGEFEVEQKITDPKLTSCPHHPDARTLHARQQSFNNAGGAISWGGRPFFTHPDRCACQADDPYPHRHYDISGDPYRGCARCVHCSAYSPALTPPPCGQPVERLIPGRTSFVLKGPGWAKDGYR